MAVTLPPRGSEWTDKALRAWVNDLNNNTIGFSTATSDSGNVTASTASASFVLSGGAGLTTSASSSTITIAYDTTSLTAITAAADDDVLAIYDTDAAAMKKITASDLNRVVQEEYAEVLTTSSFTTVIPLDDTIPQNTEGTEQITVSITPTDTSNILFIEAVFNGSCGATASGVAALFQDSTANALNATVQTIGTTGTTHRLTHRMTAGTTSSTTFKLRYGTSTGTAQRNADSSGTRLFGGVMATYIRVTELQP